MGMRLPRGIVMSMPASRARATRTVRLTRASCPCPAVRPRAPAKSTTSAQLPPEKTQGATTSTPEKTTPANNARGWRKYASRFRSAPASHVVSFAVLHELTAVLSLPVVYLSLQTLDPPLPTFSEETLAGAEHQARKILATFGFNGLDGAAGDKDSGGGPAVRGVSKNVLHAAGAYALVKFIMPLRIAACFALTPWFARVCVIPVIKATASLRSLLAKGRVS